MLFVPCASDFPTAFYEQRREGLGFLTLLCSATRLAREAVHCLIGQPRVQGLGFGLPQNQVF